MKRKELKRIVGFFSLLFVLTSTPVFAQVEVSVEGDHVRFLKGGKEYIAPIAATSKLAAVYIVYPKRDFSEYILGPDPKLYFATERKSRAAEPKEWEKLEREWKQIQKSVSFGHISGGVKVDASRRYTLLGVTSIDDFRLVNVFKVEYLNTGRENVEVLDYHTFKIQPEPNKPFLLGRDNGKFVPVTTEAGAQVVKIAITP